MCNGNLPPHCTAAFQKEGTILGLLAGTSLLVVFLPVVEEAGSVQLTRIVISLCKQLHHLIKHRKKNKRLQYVSINAPSDIAHSLQRHNIINVFHLCNLSLDNGQHQKLPTWKLTLLFASIYTVYDRKVIFYFPLLNRRLFLQLKVIWITLDTSTTHSAQLT